MAITLAQSSWAVGVGAPIGGPINNCYIYMDQSTSDVYLYVNDEWQLVFNLIGAAGDGGPRGATWFVGTTPASNFAPEGLIQGDMYLYQTGMVIYQYNGTSWVDAGSILGTATTGESIPGANGSPGNIWYTQVTAPTNANIGDMWLQSSTLNIYQYQDTTVNNLPSANWIYVCGLSGTTNTTVNANLSLITLTDNNGNPITDTTGNFVIIG